MKDNISFLRKLFVRILLFLLLILILFRRGRFTLNLIFIRGLAGLLGLSCFTDKRRAGCPAASSVTRGLNWDVFLHLEKGSCDAVREGAN